jgi:helicase
MKLNDLPIDSRVLEILIDHEISDLYPPQVEALPYIIKGENMVLAIPTASGKSLVAYLSIINRLINSPDGKAIYVVPLKALAREKYEELKLFEKLGFKVGISTGDLDDSDLRIFNYDIIVCTSEKADSLLRHSVRWVESVKVLVIDEIHLINDALRGPTLEVIISRFKALNPNTQIIALSATIKNATDLSSWLNSKLIQSKWRPVPLREGVCFKNKIKFDDGKEIKIEGLGTKSIDVLVESSISNGGQVLVFVNTRKSTVSVAYKLSSLINKMLSENEKNEINKILMNLKQKQTELTSIDEKLFYCLKNGVAFHNAGLSSFQRNIIEHGFKNRLIKCIVATPTLAAGVNIPAQRVIIRDLWRYDSNFGMTPIPIMEFKQQAGRAGRPRYDKEGEAIAIAKNKEQMDLIFESYILGETEPIFSKLGSQAALRMHLLSSIATNFVDDFDSISIFIDSTFYAFQSDTFALRDDVEIVIDFLLKNGFIEKIGDKFISTLFGKRTSSLYIDPLSALQLKKALECSCNKDTISLSFLHAVCSTPDVRSLYIRKSDFWIEEIAEKYGGDLLLDLPDITSEEYNWFLSDLKTAMLVQDWIEEISEDKIITKYNVGPGDIHNIVEMASWILYASREFARMYNFECISEINDLILQVQYGCKKELLNLVSLKGIGRVRARAR